MSVTEEQLIADGWSKVDPGGYTSVAGPFWLRTDEDGERSVGVLIEERHTNNHMGTVHGGVVMAFADIALGVAVSGALGHTKCATMNLSTQFVATAKVGEFMTCKAEVVRSTKQIVFVRGILKVEDRAISNVDGIWKVFEKKD